MVVLFLIIIIFPMMLVLCVLTINIIVKNGKGRTNVKCNVKTGLTWYCANLFSRSNILGINYHHCRPQNQRYSSNQTHTWFWSKSIQPGSPLTPTPSPEWSINTRNTNTRMIIYTRFGDSTGQAHTWFWCKPPASRIPTPIQGRLAMSGWFIFVIIIRNIAMHWPLVKRSKSYCYHDYHQIQHQ